MTHNDLLSTESHFLHLRSLAAISLRIPWALRGELATTEEIWRAFEARVGHEVDDSTVYRLLARHAWRKLMPRPRHPQADPRAQEQFKKTLRRRLRRQSRRGKPTTNAPC
jgi:hypothetical protein